MSVYRACREHTSIEPSRHLNAGPSIDATDRGDRLRTDRNVSPMVRALDPTRVAGTCARRSNRPKLEQPVSSIRTPIALRRGSKQFLDLVNQVKQATNRLRQVALGTAGVQKSFGIARHRIGRHE